MVKIFLSVTPLQRWNGVVSLEDLFTEYVFLLFWTEETYSTLIYVVTSLCISTHFAKNPISFSTIYCKFFLKEREKNKKNSQGIFSPISLTMGLIFSSYDRWNMFFYYCQGIDKIMLFLLVKATIYPWFNQRFFLFFF